MQPSSEQEQSASRVFMTVTLHVWQNTADYVASLPSKAAKGAGASRSCGFCGCRVCFLGSIGFRVYGGGGGCSQPGLGLRVMGACWSVGVLHRTLMYNNPHGGCSKV